ncbi:DegT/DnrJ/EryC1/StrS family aminotransferase [Paracoccaceae bacterium]|nr:DegT/DnrJ/EryC1/StrS family aminotransferase [Paracoccaceae bacterium]
MIRLIKPYLKYSEVEKEFREIFETGIFTRGQYLSKFSEDLKEYVGAEHAFLTTSATTALWTCLKILNVGPGDEVAIADFSFPATANVVEDVGAIPTFVDVNPDTFNMNLADLKKKITNRTKAVIFVDSLGNPTGLHDISVFCKEKNIPLIEDAACALGSYENNQMCGSVADLTCFSFHPRKLLCTGEGGAITTSNHEWARQLKIKLMHGGVVDNRIGMDFVDFGYNFRMTELQAVMGIKQLKKLDAVIASRNNIREQYIANLSSLNFIPQSFGKSVGCNVQSIVFKMPDGYDRDALIGYLKGKGVEATLGTYCQSGTTYYSRRYQKIQPTAMSLEKNSITLPCYDQVPIDYIVNQIRTWLLLF